jgi:hypothetical protein
VRIRLVIATAALFALAAAPASAKIVVNRSIAGVKLGMSQQQVLDRLGSPATTITNQALDTIYTYKKRGLAITFRPHGSTNDVTLIEVTKAGERTASGVGVGSTYNAARAGLSGERCVRAPNPRQRWCTVLSGNRQTTFVISSRKRVHEVVFSYRGD